LLSIACNKPEQTVNCHFSDVTGLPIVCVLTFAVVPVAAVNNQGICAVQTVWVTHWSGSVSHSEVNSVPLCSRYLVWASWCSALCRPPRPPALDILPLC